MDKAIELFEKLAAKIGQTAEILWPHAVRYEALSALGYIIIPSVAAIALWLFYWKYTDLPWTFPCATGRADDRYPSAKLFLIIAAPIFTLLAIAAWFFNIAIVLEPIGYTVMKILGKP